MEGCYRKGDVEAWLGRFSTPNTHLHGAHEWKHESVLGRSVEWDVIKIRYITEHTSRTSSQLSI